MHFMTHKTILTILTIFISLTATAIPARRGLIPLTQPDGTTFNAVFRVRSVAAFAIHKFFNERNFVYVHTPIITSSDCEGAGEMFNLNTFDLAIILPPP